MRPGVWTAALAVAVASAAAAQPVETSGPIHLPPLAAEAAPAAASELGPAEPVARTVGCPPAEQTARFDVTYIGFPADAQRTVQAALDTWSCHVASRLPIRVSAKWERLAASTLGSAGPTLYRNFRGAPAADTWYPGALADDLSGEDLGGSRADIEALFNSSFGSWNLDVGVQPQPDQYDLYTVVLHEIGHGLGLIGSLRVDEDQGFVGGGKGPEGAYVYDRFAQTDAGTLLLNETVYPEGSLALALALQRPTAFDGRGTRRAFGRPAPLYSPPRWVSGGSHSHLDEAQFVAGEPDGLLTPFISRGESHDAPGPTLCGMLSDIGWRLGARCVAQIGALDPLTTPLSVRLVGPNPFRENTALEVTPAVPQHVRVDLVDALGREVARLLDADLGAGEGRRIDVTAAGRPAGLLFVRIVSDAGTTAIGLTQLR